MRGVSFFLVFMTFFFGIFLFIFPIDIIIIMQVQAKLPNQLAYSAITPKGYPSIYKQWINDPLTGNKTWARNDIVRWNFMNSKRGVFDPYRSFIEITVSVNIQDMPVGGLQIDSSAHSFINQMVIYSANKQVQRITQYSVLLAYLNDIGLSEFLSEGREAQGLGYSSFDTQPYNKAQNSLNVTPRNYTQPPNNTFQTTPGQTQSISTVFPTIGNNFPINSNYSYMSSIFNASKAAKGHVTNANFCIVDDPNGGDQQGTQLSTRLVALDRTGYANNMRSQYVANIISTKFPQSTQCVPNWQTRIQKQVSGGVYPFKFSGRPYLPAFSETIQQTLFFDTQSNTANHYVSTANFGFGTLYSPLFTKGCFQPFISPTIPQCSILNGKITRNKFPIVRKKFKIPLASAVMGCLIDPTSYCLLPLQAINDVLLEITLDQYAMFTFGYNDVSEFDDVGMKIQQKRCWNIDRMQYKLHTYFFVEPSVEQHIQASLYQQITVVNNFWCLGNQYQIQGGTLVNNTYIVGCSATHLSDLVCLFIPNDYQSKTFCRKHFRLSNNIRRFWSKLSVDYWPPQPFKGNGGNVNSNSLQDDNTIFIENLYWANNYMFGKNALPRINSHNFAINDRCYNPNNTRTFYDPAMLVQGAKYIFGPHSVNADTAMGMPYVHENRFIGKAAYIIPYTPFNDQSGLLQGINVSGLSNFEVVFQTESTEVFPRDQTLYIFCKSAVVVKYGKQGIKTYGR